MAGVALNLHKDLNQTPASLNDADARPTKPRRAFEYPPATLSVVKPDGVPI
jgi:hypothetical protein